jgi:hypothetical protein
MRRYQLFPFLLTTVAVIGIWMFLYVGKPLIAYMGSELFSLTYEFFLMVVIGSGVSALFQTMTYGREARDRRRELQRELHQTIVSGWNEAKRARRLLRARGRVVAAPPAPSIAAIDPAEYDRQIEALSNAQLSLELAARRIEVNGGMFPSPEAILESISAVAKYLNSIVDEWEELRPSLSKASQPLPIAALPELGAFIQPYADSPRFRDGFKIPFDRALRLLEEAHLSES